jgi:hypothetical protein
MPKRTYRKVILMTALAGFASLGGYAREGMWQPTKLKRQESDMQKLGLKIPVEELYNEQGTGLNNAVVLFGQGCTGEIISGKGLLLTNHHCAYTTAQSLSTPQNNYLVNGFWARNQQEELPCPGLKVTFVRRTEDVTEHILKNITDSMPEDQRNKKITERIADLQKAYKKLQGLDAEIKPYYNGNQYWVTLSETFTDIRMVGFPPNGIGKFGADTDNWMWPRNTGDFSVFRVYSGTDNKPAAYSPSNIAYKPQKFFQVNTTGYKEGDFTMVYGFPYQTQEYLSSYQMNQIQYISDPIRIESRDKKLSVWDKAMRADPNVFLKYAAKQSSLSNGFKKWKGEVLGLEINDVIGKKQSYEKSFQEAASMNTGEPGDKMLLTRIQAAVLGSDNALIASEYTKETVLGVEAIAQASYLDKTLKLYRSDMGAAEIQDSLSKMRTALELFYKNYDAATDQKVFDALMPLYMQQGEQVVAPQMKSLLLNSGNNYVSWSKNIYNHAYTANPERMLQLLDRADRSDSTAIKTDPAYQVYSVVSAFQKEKITPVLNKYTERIAPLNRMYMKRQMEYLNSGKAFYPDANQTLRLTYGQVEGISLESGDRFQTTLDDLIPRHNEAVEEFNIPQGLRNLFQTKNYGRWAVNGTVPVNFIGSNHTSSGNSGSPVLNGKGQLIGINFDRIWQGTMSDIYYDPALCRNITVDIRYVLFIIEKFGNAGWLLNEMKLVSK